MIKKQFLKSSFIYTIGSALPLASSFLLLPFYTRLDLTLFGQFAIYSSFALLIQNISNWGLGTSIGVHFFEYKTNELKFREFLSQVLGAFVSIGLGLLLLLYFSGEALFNLVLKDPGIRFIPYGLASAATGIMMSIFKSYSGLLIVKEKPLKFLFINILHLAGTVGLSIWGIVYFPDTLHGPVFGRFAGTFIAFFLVFILLVKDVGISFNPVFFRLQAAFCFPIMLYEVFMWLFNYIDRFLLSNMLTNSDVGTYDFAIKISQVIDFIQLGIGNTILPIVFEHFRTKGISMSQQVNSKYYHTFSGLTMLMIPFVIEGLRFFIPLFIHNPNYDGAIAFLPIVIGGYLFTPMLSMYTAPVYFLKDTKALPVVYLVSSLFFILSGIVLIRYFGLTGACINLLLSKPYQILSIYLFYRKKFQLQFNTTKIVLAPVVFSVGLIAVYFITYKELPFLYNLLVYAGLMAATTALYFEQIKEAVQFGVVKLKNI